MIFKLCSEEGGEGAGRTGAAAFTAGQKAGLPLLEGERPEGGEAVLAAEGGPSPQTESPRACPAGDRERGPTRELRKEGTGMEAKKGMSMPPEAAAAEAEG